MATVDELKRKRSLGDAAAAATDASVQQIPTGGYAPAPQGPSASGSELGRNVANTLSALPGTAGLRLATTAVPAVTSALTRSAVQPAAWELVNEGGQLATQAGRAAPAATTALPGAGSALARAPSMVPNAATPQIGDAAAGALRLAAPPGGPISRVSSMVTPAVTAETQLAAAARAAPAAAAGGGIGAALVSADTTGTPTSPAGALQAPKYGTASPPVDAGAGRGNVNPTPAADLPYQPTFGADGGRGVANDPRRTDMDPARASLGAARDFAAELNTVPRELPADLRSGVVVKTIDPATGRVTYSGRNVGAGADGLTQMVDGTGRDLRRLGAPTGDFASAVDASGRATSFAAPGMNGAISIDGRQPVISGADRLGAAPTGSSALDALASRNDGSIGARAALARTQYDQEVAQANAINSRPFGGSGGTLGIRRDPGIVAAEQSSIEGLNRARGADPFSRKLALQQRELDQTGQIASQLQVGENSRALLKDRGDTTRAQIEAAAKVGGSVPVGYRFTPGGKLEAIPGGPADAKAAANANKPLTDTQAKALQFGSRMQVSGKLLDDLAAGGTNQPGLVKRGAEAVGVGGLANWTQSESQQQVDQAQRDFVNAVLRRESGAAISPGEFENAQKQYFPQPGDEPKTLAQKRRNRDLATQGILAEVPDSTTRVAQVTAAAAPGTLSAVRTGTVNGRKVTQYSDGSIEYAN